MRLTLSDVAWKSQAAR